MTESISRLRLRDAWRECKRNQRYMSQALASLAALLPVTPERFGHLADEEVKNLDQFIYRFSKLQDAMGGRLFSILLQVLEEPYEDRPLLDKLNRLEQLGLIPSAESWHRIRATRNRFAHEYPDDWDKNSALINQAVSAAAEINRSLDLIQARLSDLGLTQLLPNS